MNNPLDFTDVVKEAYDFCYSKSYPELPLDSDILEELPNYIGWEFVELDTIEKYHKWLSAVRCELETQHLEYKED